MERDGKQPGMYRNAKGQVRRLLSAKDGHYAYEAIQPRVRCQTWLQNYRGDHGLPVGEYEHDCWVTTWQKWLGKDGVRMPDDWQPEHETVLTIVVPHGAQDRFMEFAMANGIKVI